MSTDRRRARWAAICRRWVQTIVYAVGAISALCTAIDLITRSTAGSASLERNNLYGVAIVALVSFGLVCAFRALEGGFIIPRGKVFYRGATAAILLWLFCFGVCMAAVLLASAIIRIPPRPTHAEEPSQMPPSVAPNQGPSEKRSGPPKPEGMQPP